MFLVSPIALWLDFRPTMALRNPRASGVRFLGFETLGAFQKMVDDGHVAHDEHVEFLTRHSIDWR